MPALPLTEPTIGTLAVSLVTDQIGQIEHDNLICGGGLRTVGSERGSGCSLYGEEPRVVRTTTYCSDMYYVYRLCVTDKYHHFRLCIC